MGGENTLALVEEKLVLPPKFYTKGDEPDPEKSFGVSSTTRTLLDALKKTLRPDEWDEIWQSKLGVFLKFHEQNISQASRLGHFLPTWQVACNKRNEIWSLIGVTPIRFSLYEFEHITGLNCEYVEELMTPAVEVTTEMVEFWEMLGTDVSVGPSFARLLHACGRCGAWERENRLRLGYLANFIDAKPHTQPTDVNLARLVMDLERFVSYLWGRVAFKIVIDSVKEADITKTYSIKGFAQVLQSWSYFALPEFASEYGSPFRNSEEVLPILAYGGSKGRKSLRSGMLKQTRIISFVRKEFDEMFPLWDDDGEDQRTVNILRAMYGQIKADWRWEKEHWPLLGVRISKNKVKVEPGKGIKRESQADVDDATLKKPCIGDDHISSLKNNLVDAVLSAVDARLDKLEAGVSEKWEELGKKINFLADKVDEVLRVTEALKVNPAGTVVSNNLLLPPFPQPNPIEYTSKSSETDDGETEEFENIGNKEITRKSRRIAGKGPDAS